MKTLYKYIEKYIKNHRMTIDGHIHLFDWNTHSIFDEYKPLKSFDTFVGFMGVDFDNIDKYSYENCIKYYDNFIKANKNNVILLASGLDSKTVIQNYENHRDIMMGFGELLCYAKYDDMDLPYKKLDWIYDILDHNTGHLPVFIHYSLTSDKYLNDIDELISKYPNTPIVICHCGLPNIHEGKYDDKFSEIFKRFLKLQSKYKNIYTDVCDSAFLYLRDNMVDFLKLDLSRVFIGTDITPVHFRQSEKDIKSRISKSLKKFNMWAKNINNEMVIKKLFNL